MSRSYHQSHKISKKGSSSFVIEGDKRYIIKNKYKDLRDIEVQHDKVVKWKKKKHIAYGEQRNFNFKGEPTYTNEKYLKGIGEYCFPCIEKQKERKKNKISIYDNFDDY